MSPIASLYFSWSLTALWPITGRIASGLMDPVLFNFACFTLAVAAMTPWLAAQGRWRRFLEPGLRLPFFVVGGLGSGVTSVLLTIGVSLTTSANAAIVCQVEVVYSAILASLLLGERISGRQAAASGLVVLGTALILANDLGTPHWKGDLLILATPWMFQVSHVFSKRLPADVDEITIAGGRTFYGALVLAPIALWKVLFGAPQFEFGAASAALIAFHGLILSALTLVTWYRALRNIELAKTTAIMLSYPALTLVYCWLLGMEPIGVHQVAGLVLSLGGALWLTSQVNVSASPPVVPASIATPI